MDIGLYPPSGPLQSLSAFNEVPEALRSDAIETIDSLRNMPYQLCQSQDQSSWDIILLRSQVPNLSFGIPGESQCFKCQDSESPKTFHSVSERINHDFLAHCDESFQCALCRAKFGDNLGLLKHFESEHLDQMKNMNSRYEILFGVPEQDQDGWLNCKFCPGTFFTDVAFYFHVHESHKPQQNCLKCQKCGKILANSMDFKRHILVSHGEYTYSCILCGKRYG